MDEKEIDEKKENQRQRNAIKVVMSIASTICFVLYAGTLVAAYIRARVGDDLYFSYACAATIFVLLMALVMTINAGIFLNSFHLDETLRILIEKNALAQVAESKTPKTEKVNLITVKESFSLESTFGEIHEFNEHTWQSFVGTFLFICLFFLSINSFAWALFVSLYHDQRQFRSGYAYIIVDFTSGFIAPILILCSMSIGMALVSYYTKGRLSMRYVIPKLFYSVKLKNRITKSDNKGVKIVQKKENNEISEDDKIEKGIKLKVKYQYWEILDQFKWDLKVKEGSKEDPKQDTEQNKKDDTSWFESHYSTWALWIVICIAGLFSFAQFIDATVIEEMESTDCLPQFDCFIALNKFQFTYFPCDTSNNTYESFLQQTNSNITVSPKYYCFRFKDFGFDSDVILAVGNAYALYLLQIAIFDKIIGNFHTFLHLKLYAPWIVFYLIITNTSAVLVFLVNLLSDFQHLVYDVLRSWNILNFILYHIVVGGFIVTYFWQEQWKEHGSSKSEKKVS